MSKRIPIDLINSVRILHAKAGIDSLMVQREGSVIEEYLVRALSENLTDALVKEMATRGKLTRFAEPQDQTFQIFFGMEAGLIPDMDEFSKELQKALLDAYNAGLRDSINLVPRTPFEHYDPKAHNAVQDILAQANTTKEV